MMDPDTREALAKSEAERRAKGQPVIDEMKALVNDLEAEVRAMKKHVNAVAVRYGIARPYMEVA